MKKIILSLGAVAAIAAPIATVVACGDNDKKIEFDKNMKSKIIKVFSPQVSSALKSVNINVEGLDLDQDTMKVEKFDQNDVIDGKQGGITGYVVAIKTNKEIKDIWAVNGGKESINAGEYIYCLIGYEYEGAKFIKPQTTDWEIEFSIWKVNPNSKEFNDGKSPHIEQDRDQSINSFVAIWNDLDRIYR